jgi:hypothetical protein
MAVFNPVKGITSKIWLQAKVSFWKIRFVASDLLKH